ncbi:FAD-dependent oxidoreductase [Streptomyces sp. TRM 70351]|uniref:FAD-dependent oxidoreductase n=1 Tax=Streptomyces sp. TRM 70351 TaxID=3116552 RepID=UPI002E7B67AE|nr:FAD-dependent oxidoreductase [Streptomyces sp. TRM 70351]MEE1930192.1 FAD-dependent oxidoreductase [Streptomyces sp. TRM 70351]
MKAVICGAGIAGLACAQRLDTLGWDVVVLEKAPGPRAQGYMIDFFGPGYDAAEDMGVLPALLDVSYRVEEAAYRDARGRRRAGLSYERFADALDGRLFSIMRPDLERALRAHLRPGVELRYGTGPRAVDDTPDGVRVTLTDGTALDADLLVGADGIHSTVRELVFGPEDRFLRYLGFHTAAYLFTDPGLRDAVAGRFNLTDTAGRQMGFYGLRDGRVAAFTVHRTPDPSLPADPRAAVRRAYAGLGWITPRALDLCPPSDEVYYDQVAQVTMDRWSHGRTVLLGDACYAVSLLAGQGASLAVAGAHVLARHLERAASVPAALDGYERAWHPVTVGKQRVARNAARWFLPGSPWELLLRRIALRATALPGVDRYVATALVGKPTTVVPRP